jgi:hypothetical protein
MSALVLALALFQGAVPPSRAPTYPFAVGETLTYSAKLGLLTLGSGTLEVASLDSIRGEETFRFRFRLQGKTFFFSMDDVLESWVGTRDFNSRRFLQNFVENNKTRRKLYEIYPDSGFFRESGRPLPEPSPSDPLDDAAFFYFVRITPLEVGKNYSFDRYFKKKMNPVRIEVLKKEKLELPDGKEVDCLVLHPVLETKGMFSKRSDTRLWVTDDARRLPVQIRSKFNFGTITLRLKEMVLPGTTTSAATDS